MWTKEGKPLKVFELEKSKPLNICEIDDKPLRVCELEDGKPLNVFELKKLIHLRFVNIIIRG